MEPEQEALQVQLKVLHEDLLTKFAALKDDNESIKLRLSQIEIKLGIHEEPSAVAVDNASYISLDDQPLNKNKEEEKLVENIEQAELDKDNEETMRESALETKFEEEFQFEDEVNREEDLLNDEEDKVTTTPKVALEPLDTSSYQGFCFRPLAAWKNSLGKHEMSKEQIEIGEDDIELRIFGCDSAEEIAKIKFSLKDIERVEVIFDTRTILYCYVGSEICEAAAQSLAMTNISSFSLVHQEGKRIRICFQAIDDGKKALLREYFRRNAIYFKIINQTLPDKIFFKPVRKALQPKYDSNKPLPLADFVNTIKTIKYFDRTTYTCKVCNFYNVEKEAVLRHVTKFHLALKTRKQLSDKDIFMQYINTNTAERQ